MGHHAFIQSLKHCEQLTLSQDNAIFSTCMKAAGANTRQSLEFFIATKYRQARRVSQGAYIK